LIQRGIRTYVHEARGRTRPSLYKHEMYEKDPFELLKKETIIFEKEKPEHLTV
jgi:hypothetical protein